MCREKYIILNAYILEIEKLRNTERYQWTKYFFALKNKNRNINENKIIRKKEQKICEVE